MNFIDSLNVEIINIFSLIGVKDVFLSIKMHLKSTKHLYYCINDCSKLNEKIKELFSIEEFICSKIII